MPENLLPKLRGEDIAKANKSLPPCREDSPETMTAAVEVPHYGLVVITFSKFRQRFHKSRRWFWVAESAALHDAEDLGQESPYGAPKRPDRR